MQTACYWQLCFSDRLTGARNPARLTTMIQSRRIRCAPFPSPLYRCWYPPPALAPICDNKVTLQMADGNSASPRFREAFRALRYYNFRLFFSGQLISLVGTWMQMVAQLPTEWCRVCRSDRRTATVTRTLSLWSRGRSENAARSIGRYQRSHRSCDSGTHDRTCIRCVRYFLSPEPAAEWACHWPAIFQIDTK